MAAIFSRGFDTIVRRAAVGLGLAAALFVAGWYYYAYPDYTRVGYMPEQPVPFSHKLHVGQLGMDCRYCHTHVEDSAFANVPATQTCMNCHNGVDPGKANVKGNSPLLSPVRESWKSGNPVQWKQVHKLPGYAYFEHRVHVARGVSCVSCHGQVNEMPVVFHAKELTMGWCLKCHENPDPNLRPPGQVTNMTWKPEGNKTAEEVGAETHKTYGQNAPLQCGGCHR